MVRVSEERESHNTISRTGAPRGLWLGLVLGVSATLVVVGMVWAARSMNRVRLPQSATMRCSGAHVTGTLWIEHEGLYTSVMVVDPKGRGWDVRWPGFAVEGIHSTMVPADHPDYTGSLLGVTQALGDTDDGTERTAQVRPRGAGAWCSLHLHASSLS